MQLRSSVFGWKSVWMELADESKGEFIDGPPAVTVRVPVKERNWTMTFKMHEHGLGGHSKQQTVIALPYKSHRRDFTFAIHNRNWIEDSLKAFGLQDIIIGDHAFDPDYIIQGNDEELVRELLSSQELKDQIRSQKSVRLRVHSHPTHLSHYGDVPNGVHVLAFHEEGAVNSFDRLRSLHDLLLQAASELCRVGVATEKDPDFVV